MSLRPDFYRTQAEAGIEWMQLAARSRRDAMVLHWLLAGIGAGMILFSVLADTLRMVP